MVIRSRIIIFAAFIWFIDNLRNFYYTNVNNGQ